MRCSVKSVRKFFSSLREGMSFALVWAALASRVVPEADMKRLLNATGIIQHYREAHDAFGCNPDPLMCPTWDCAVSYDAGGYADVLNASNATQHLRWKLCYDRGMRAYMFTTEAWCENSDCRQCTATRLVKPETAFVCSECEPCCLECKERAEWW